MDRRFRITVDGRAYQVTVEDLGEGGGLPLGAAFGLAAAPGLSVAAAAQAPATGAPPAESTTPPLASPAAAAQAGDVLATLAGVIESVAVKLGQNVRAGDTVAVVEAMKMNSPMLAHRDGSVAAVLVRTGDAVETGQALVRLA